MKKVLLVACLVIPVLFAGCKKNSKSQNSVISLPAGEPIDYLPIAPGTVLVYKIELGDVEPLVYKEVIWPQTKGSIVMVTRSRFWGAIKQSDKEQKKVFLLKMKVKGPAAKQGGLEYPVGVELTVEKDELGVYQDAKQVFWAATSKGRFMCHEVVTYSSDTPGSPQAGAWGNWGAEEGFSMRILFFGERPDTQVGMGKDSKDKLLFDGIKPVPGSSDSGLHFVRTVEPQAKKENIGSIKSIDSSMLDKGFREDSYFLKGKGLVYLEQKVDGKTSMIWRITDSSE